MSFNVVLTNEPLQMNNGLNTIHRKINKLPLISLINKKNFKLTNKKAGKILNKPIYSGFNKNTLSSIPRDVEIILLNKKKDEILTVPQNILNNPESSSFYLNDKERSQTLNDYNKSSSFFPNASDEKRIYKGKTTVNMSKAKSKDNKNLTKFKKKDIKKKIIADDKGKISSELFESRYLPGPTDYASDKSFDVINQRNKYRYKGLFKNQSYKAIKKTHEQLPGPGSYLKIKNLINNNDKHVSINLGTKEKRFKNLFSSASLSPWFYSSAGKKSIKEVNKSDLLNKDLYDFRRYIIKEEIDDRGNLKQIYIEDKSYVKKNDQKIDDNNIQIKNKPKKIDDKKNQNKLDNLLKKYILVRNVEKEYEVPGPGQYNIYMGFDKINRDKAIEKLQVPPPPKQEKLIPDEVLKNFEKNKNINSNSNVFCGGTEDYKVERFKNSNKSCGNIYRSENKKNINGTFPFISKEKRIKFQDSILSKHTPGPCYYYNDDYY